MKDAIDITYQSPSSSSSSTTPTTTVASNGHDSITVATTGSDYHNNGELYQNNAMAHASLLRRITYRIMPLLMVAYSFALLDRSALANVHTHVMDDIGITEQQYGYCVSLFFPPYILLELPSNWIMERTSYPNRWLARIVISWGIVATMTMTVTTYTGLMITRVALGMAEAGFVSGMLYYLTLWFKPHERAQRLFFIFGAQPLAGVTGSILSYGILSTMDRVAGLPSWRWLFAMEGAPAIVLGIMIWLWLPANPTSATWLTHDQRSFLTHRMVHQQQHHKSMSDTNNGSERTRLLATHQHHRSSSESIETTNHHNNNTTWLRRTMIAVHDIWRTTFGNIIVWLCMTINFLILLPILAVTFYLPAMVSDLGLSAIYGNLLAALPFGCAAIAMLLNAIHSDRHRERLWHVLIPNGVAIMGLMLLAWAMDTNYSVRIQLLLLCIAVSGIYAGKPVYMAWMTTILRGRVALALAAIACTGNIAGIVAPLMMSHLRQMSGHYTTGCVFLSAMLVIASLLTIILRHVDHHPHMTHH